MRNEIREVEEEINALFCVCFSFSKHLRKHEDDELKIKYDNNYFEYEESFSKEELKDAVEYQINKGVDFIKFCGRKPLEESYGLEEGHDIAMLLKKNDTTLWHENKNIQFRKPSNQEVKAIDLKHYGEIYGEEFTLRNVDHNASKMEYVGAYLDQKLVGICLPYCNEKYCCMDDVLVDEEYRNQYVCTSLLKHIVDNNRNKHIFLHADVDDTPKYLYAKLGFEKIDESYSYQKVGLKEYLKSL